jgi:hypothetical protein
MLYLADRKAMLPRVYLAVIKLAVDMIPDLLNEAKMDF